MSRVAVRRAAKYGLPFCPAQPTPELEAYYFEELARNGISVKGAIVITRYGGGWRGLKPKLAYENGAVGCLIYSDPRDDGYGQGDTYPKGGYRPRDAVELPCRSQVTSEGFFDNDARMLG